MCNLPRLRDLDIQQHRMRLIFLWHSQQALDELIVPLAHTKGTECGFGATLEFVGGVSGDDLHGLAGLFIECFVVVGDDGHGEEGLGERFGLPV